MVTIFVQVRYNSKRLRGKVLKKINDKPILQYIVNSLKKIRNSKVIILTSKNKSDDKIVNFCRKYSFRYFRGSHLNVYKRFCDAIRHFKPNYFVRICGDSPLQSNEIINKMIKIYNKKKTGIVTNVYPRSFPIGMSVEIINSNMFLNKEKYIKNSIHKEHITTYFYQNDKKKITNFLCKKDYSKINLSINTLKDFKKIKKFLENNKNKIESLRNVVKHFKD
tara:strand:- start:21260 stop:21922 length:663 start_codon:yes stop_codon:yes gene_type:complete